MGRFFEDDMHDEFGSWLLGYTATGGPDVGVVAAVGAAVGKGDDDAFYAAWMAAGDRLARRGGGARRTATSRCRLTLWAAVCYATSYHPLYGTPVDPRLTAAFRKQIAAFDAGLALLPRPVAPLRIPFEGTTLPGYFLPATGHEDETRPARHLHQRLRRDRHGDVLRLRRARRAARLPLPVLRRPRPGRDADRARHGDPPRLGDRDPARRRLRPDAPERRSRAASRSRAGASAAISRSAARAASRASPPASPTPASAR